MEQSEPIKIIGQDMKQEGNLLILESTLDRRPDPEWVPFMIHASVAKAGGSMTFGHNDPKVSGNKVRMPVEERDIEAAVRFIAASVSFANRRFESEILAKRQREAVLKQEKEAAQAAQLEQARERLRKVTNPSPE